MDFEIDDRVDFAYVMLGSLFAKNARELNSHFDSVARAVRKGGVYLLDWCIRFNISESSQSSWERESNGIRVRASFSSQIVDRVEQIYEDTDCLDVVLPDGEEKHFKSKSIRRVIYPQEFLLFIGARNDFEFIGWWNDWDLASPLGGDPEINRPIVLLRKT